MEANTYNFPVKNKFEAREVTEMDFILEPDSEAYVVLDDYRYNNDRKSFPYLKGLLNIDDDTLAQLSNKFLKIIFSGHRGSGKTTELKRFQNYIDDPKRYFSILVELEKEFDGSTFKPEYFYIALISKLIAKIKEEGIDFKSSELDDIVKKWTSSQENTEEIQNIAKIDISAEANMGVDFFGMLGLKNRLRSLLSGQTKSAEFIKQEIRKNPMGLISRFNKVLLDLRKTLAKTTKAKDVLFIVDGFEKLGLSSDSYDDIFFKNAHIIKAIDANMIITTPINVWYDVTKSINNNFPKDYILPMVNLSVPNAKDAFKKIITNRIDFDTFFENEEALDLIVEYSGGSPRQALEIVNSSISTSLGKPINKAHVEQELFELGRKRYEKLTTEHLEKLKSEDFNDSDDVTIDLLFGLDVLKYNGTKKINPLLSYYIENK